MKRKNGNASTDIKSEMIKGDGEFMNHDCFYPQMDIVQF